MADRTTVTTNGSYGGSLTAITEAVLGTVAEVYARGGHGAEQVEFSASNAEMGWMMPVPITPGGSASTTVKLTTEGTATIFAKFTDKVGNIAAQVEHMIRVTPAPARRAAAPPSRYGFGGSLSGISEAVLGTITDVIAQAGDGVEQVEFSASNAEMGWMMPVTISPGGSTSASVKLTSEGTATIFANFKDALGNIKAAAQHIIRVTAAPSNHPAQTGPRLGMGGILSGVTEALLGTVTEVYAQGSGEAEQVEFSVSNAEMGWMMPVNISPGGSARASVTLSSEGTATIFANFKDKMGNLLGTAQHLIRVLPDTTKSQSPTDMASLMNARAADIVNRLGRKP
ncbi:hypothetical protein [Hyphomonas sp.]|uniref:hypothetical protein n=1 Tax=Hyphomonas sp. TaxID=87 RepID=UPI0025C540E5|nr:hypothetical protein [Hyphomonas sp.]